MSVNRRSFIKYASLAAAGNAAGLRPFGALNSMAETTTDYKALVCIFLYGGNDANNMLIPFDTAGYGSYASLRGPLALAQNQLLQLGPAPNFALNPNLPDIQKLFNSGALGMVANVGTLVQPTTRAQFLAQQAQPGTTLPSNLFSHQDQQLEWQNASQASSAPTGWAGRIADSMASSYNPNATIPMVTSVAGDTLFCDGAKSTPVSVQTGNVFSARCTEGTNCAPQQATAQALLTLSSGLSLIQADSGISANAYAYAKALSNAVQSVTPIKTVFPANGMGAQLKEIASIIQVRAALGVSRQIFFAGIGNFDTHENQIAQQGTLLAQIGSAIAAFYQATQELNVQNKVTSFTMSDFNRALQPNSNSGSDHGWGSHHMVFGGAVKGGSLYGKFPDLTLGGPEDSDSNGRWIPSTSTTEYAATLAQWFGVPAAQLSSIFPNIGSFASTNLGFV
jgi:uncharacterized protein (DUF1501 family)